MIRAYQGSVPHIGNRVFVAEGSLVLGDVTLEDDVSVWFGCILRGDVNWMRIGARSNIQDHCCLHVTRGKWPLILEAEVSIAHNVMLHGCTIRRGALVGMSSTVMDGAEIGEGCIVAAGSLVREGFKAQPGTLVAGWPAAVKGELTEAQREIPARTWANYMRYKQTYVDDGWTWAECTGGGGPVRE